MRQGTDVTTSFDYSNDSGYRRIHRLLRKVRGRAEDYACISCEKPAQHWAYQNNDGTKYSEDLEDYAPMCQSCHKKMDWSHRPAEDRAHRMDRAREVARSRRSGGPGPANRRCLDCGLTTNGGAMARHLGAAHHSGYEEI